MNVYKASMDTVIGRLDIAEECQSLTHLSFGRSDSSRKKMPAHAVEQWTPFLQQAAQEILEYLDGKRKQFNLPVKLAGTHFQMAVWNALLTIPYGETRFYRDIAQQIGNGKACRAVGMANHWNPVAIIVPCHRVIGANGSLTGFGGGLDLKKQLLELESATQLKMP